MKSATQRARNKPKAYEWSMRDEIAELMKHGSVVKRLRHRPFTAVTRVRFPSESYGPLAQLVRATGS